MTTWGEDWLKGDTYNMSIGQGFVLATPLQVANATNAIANGGTPPQAADRPVHQRRGRSDHRTCQARGDPHACNVDQQHLDLIKQGMQGVLSTTT